MDKDEKLIGLQLILSIVKLNHGFHPVDERGCILNSLIVCVEFPLAKVSLIIWLSNRVRFKN